MSTLRALSSGRSENDRVVGPPLQWFSAKPTIINPSMPDTSGPEDPDFYFVTLVMNLATMALTALGEIPDPRTGRGRLDLARARTNINMLVTLKKKTQGRLSSKEAKFLLDFIDDLQGKYMESLHLGDSPTVKQQKSQGEGAGPKMDKNLERLVGLIRKKQREMDTP